MEFKDLPENRDLTYIGMTTYREEHKLFGIKRKDRRQHVYILGKSGTGKSVLMFNMIIQNIKNGEGVCVVDPHGELVEGVLSAIPPERVKDVVYFNPADTGYHIGFNVLELVDSKYKHLVASGLMGIFTKIWANAWSARMEYILNNAILALLDTPGSTLLGIPRMLVDKDYRQQIISNLKDPVIKAFWVHEYEAWQDKFRNEAIAPIQNKVGQFLSTSIIRNVVGQSQSTINVFDIMNTGKIFLVNVSKGRIGEDNSALLGGMIITKVQLAAMERVRIPEEERRDFYLYVDEFQNFVTDAFAGILSEARKYRLNLTIAHQYTAQLATKDSSAMRDAVFGNVGTMIIFRVGADDAEFLEKEFEPEFTPQDIVNLPNYKIYLKLMIDGITSRPFSSKTLPPLVKSGNKEIEDEVIKSSRALYCRPKEVVEEEINSWSGMMTGDDLATGEKFDAVCSICKKAATVPFKPEPGRPVYCKDCIGKIKSGDFKAKRGAGGKIEYDESTFYKPLSDLGIEFQAKDSNLNQSPYKQDSRPVLPRGNGVFSKIKNTFIPPKKDATGQSIKPKEVYINPRTKEQPKDKPRDNSALREILNKTLNENKVFEDKKPEVKLEERPTPEPISLDSLKSKPEINKITPAKDRSANAEEMNKLKDLISGQTEVNSPLPKVESKPQPKADQPRAEEPPKVAQPIPSQPEQPKTNVREVPEDVLKKILE